MNIKESTFFIDRSESFKKSRVFAKWRDKAGEVLISLIRHRSPIGNMEKITRFFEFVTKPFQFCFKYLGFRKRGEKVRAHVSQALIYDKIMDM